VGDTVEIAAPSTSELLALNAKRVLRNLQLVYPRGHAVVAGGYLRDMALGVSPKDMDVFLMADDAEGISKEAIDAIEQAVGCVQWMISDGEYWQSGSIIRCGVAKQDPIGQAYPIPVNVIVLRRGYLPKDDARMNDFGICQVWYDGFAMGATPAFFRDIEQQTFTLSVCENEAEFQRSMRRWLRLHEKYPAHRLVIPERFRAFAPPLAEPGA